MVSADVFPLVLRTLELIGGGKTHTAACDEAGISYTTFKRYVNDTPELQELFDNACQRGHDTMADSLVTVDQYGAIRGVTDPKMLSILSRNIQWYLARRAPKTYGDKVVHEHNITADRAIIEALSRGKERALLSPPTIELTATEVKPDKIIDEAIAHGFTPELLQFI